MEGSETAYFVSSVSWHRNRDDGEQKTSISVDICQYENGQNIKSFESQIPNCDSVGDAIKEALQSVWRIIVSEKQRWIQDSSFYRHRIQDCSYYTNTILSE